MCKTELWPFLTIFGTGMRASEQQKKAKEKFGMKQTGLNGFFQPNKS